MHTGQPDTFKAGFFAQETTWFSRDLFGMRVIGLDTYDKADGSRDLEAGASAGAASNTETSGRATPPVDRASA